MKEIKPVGCSKVFEKSIKNANLLANGVQTYYVNGRRDYVIENQNMTLGYVLTRDNDQQVSYICNKNGNCYIKNTMDAFVTLHDGTTVFSSKTSKNTTSNIFRYGYYYYEVRLEEQDFYNGITENNSFCLLFDNVLWMFCICVDNILNSMIKL